MTTKTTMWLIEAPRPKWPDSPWLVYERDGDDTTDAVVEFHGPDAEARARAYHRMLTGPHWSTVGPQLVAVLAAWTETAPKDGTRVLCYWPGASSDTWDICAARWEGR